MIVFLDLNGQICLSETTERVGRNSANVNEIYIVSKMPAATVFSLSFRLPNGELIGENLAQGTSTEIAAPIDIGTLEEFNVWRYIVPAAVTSISGIVTFSIYGTTESMRTSTSGTFSVDVGVTPILPPTPSQDVYGDIRKAITSCSQDIITLAGDVAAEKIAIRQELANTAKGLAEYLLYTREISPTFEDGTINPSTGEEQASTGTYRSQEMYTFAPYEDIASITVNESGVFGYIAEYDANGAFLGRHVQTAVDVPLYTSADCRAFRITAYSSSTSIDASNVGEYLTINIGRYSIKKNAEDIVKTNERIDEEHEYFEDLIDETAGALTEYADGKAAELNERIDEVKEEQDNRIDTLAEKIASNKADINAIDARVLNLETGTQYQERTVEINDKAVYLPAKTLPYININTFSGMSAVTSTSLLPLEYPRFPKGETVYQQNGDIEVEYLTACGDGKIYVHRWGDPYSQSLIIKEDGFNLAAGSYNVNSLVMNGLSNDPSGYLGITVKGFNSSDVELFTFSSYAEEGDGDTNQQFTVPENTSYITVSFDISHSGFVGVVVPEITVNQSATTNITLNKIDKVDILGKNILPNEVLGFDNWYAVSGGRHAYELSIPVDGIYKFSAVPAFLTFFYLQKYIEDDAAWVTSNVCYDRDGEVQSGFLCTETTNNLNILWFEYHDGDRWRLLVYDGLRGEEFVSTIKDLQLEKVDALGAPSTPYAPYTLQRLAVPADLVERTEYGHGLEGAKNAVDVPSKTYAPRLAIVDLGSASWSYDASAFCWRTNDFSAVLVGTESALEVPPMLTDGWYMPSNGMNVSNGKITCVDGVVTISPPAGAGESITPWVSGKHLLTIARNDTPFSVDVFNSVQQITPGGYLVFNGDNDNVFAEIQVLERNW